MSYIDRTSYIHKFGNDIWYVDSNYGDDNNSGERPDKALASIGYAIYLSSEGDMINVTAGVYDEHSLDLNKNGLKLYGDHGVEINDSTGGVQTLLVSAEDCHIKYIHVSQSGQTGIKITGTDCYFDHIHIQNCTIALDILGNNNHINKCLSIYSSVTGFNISSSGNTLETCVSVGSGTSTRGIYLSSSNSDSNYFYNCTTSGNATAGYEVVSGASYNIFKDCSMGGGDGIRIDLGSRTQWANFIDRLPRENHQHIYPICDGEGTACTPITINNIAGDETGTSSDRYYWGEPKVIVPTDTLTDIWTFLGYNIFGTTAAKELQGALMRINSEVVGSKYTGGGDQNWDEGETVLTLTNTTEASRFEVDDLVWITSSTHTTDGEIARVTDVTGSVVTIERETVNSGRTGLRWNHTTDGDSEKMYLVYRESNFGMHGHCINWSCASSKDSDSVRFHFPKEFKANDGLLIRIQNLTDDLDAEFDIIVMYV